MYKRLFRTNPLGYAVHFIKGIAWQQEICRTDPVISVEEKT